MTKIEIEGKCCHGHSNHELKVNTVILIQIIKHVDALFLKVMTFFVIRFLTMFLLPLTFGIPNKRSVDRFLVKKFRGSDGLSHGRRFVLRLSTGESPLPSSS
jgi:hypothetical protein